MSRLIEAGLEVFSAVGYDAATTRMVAERAGTNEALIARYFRGKAGLLTAIIVASISEAEIAAQDYPRGKNAETEIRNFMLHRLDHESARREFIRIGISRAAVDLKIRQEISKIVPIHGSPVLTSRLVDLQKKQMLRPGVDPHEISQMVMIQSIGLNFMSTMIDQIDKVSSQKLILAFSAALGKSIDQR